VLPFADVVDPNQHLFCRLDPDPGIESQHTSFKPYLLVILGV